MRTLLHQPQYLLTIAGTLLLIGCTSAVATPPATVEPSPIPDTPPPTVTHTPEPVPCLPTDQPQPTDVLPSLPTSTPDIPLSENGPWLVFKVRLDIDAMRYNFWISNLDGTGLTQLPGEVRYWTDFSLTLHPEKGAVAAYVTGDEPALELLYLPSGQTETITALTSETTAFPVTLPPYQEGGINYIEIARAITNWPLWSPDGRSLAFVGAMNGTSADIYTYSLDTGEITQITSGPTQASHPIWSPDGRHILHLGIKAFGTGAGDNADAIWVSRSDGSGSIRLASYPDGQNTSAALFGWMSNNVVLVSDQVAASNNNLRLIDITTGETETIWEHDFSSFALDRETNTFMIAPYLVYQPGQEYIGLWMYRSGYSLQQIIDKPTQDVSWLPGAGVFYAELDKTVSVDIVLVDTDGNITAAPVPERTKYWIIKENAGGQAWAWFGMPDGLWVGPFGETPECVFEEEIQWVQWMPDGTGMFVATEEAIYYTPYPDLNFQAIVSGMNIARYRGWFVPEH